MASPLLAFGFVLVGLFADLGAAGEEPLDRIVAVVGEHPFFLSELRQRVRPLLDDVATAPPPERRAETRAQLLREMLHRMIDEELLQKEADKNHLHVQRSEIDAALETIAKQARISREDLLAEVKKRRISEADYRAEIGRQLLEGKLVQLRVRSRVKVTEADAKREYEIQVNDEARGQSRSAPRFESLKADVKAEMMERATFKALERERRRWLGELRDATFVDVRL